jgi:Protein of unknown function (DUF4244)
VASVEGRINVRRLFVSLESRLAAFRERLRSDDGQSTAEYALVILAAAAIALVLLAWARSSGKLPAFFDSIIDRIVGQSE